MASLKYVSLITTLTVFTALFSIILQAFIESRNLQKLTTILTGLVYLENVNKLETSPKISIGYGSCSDLYVRATTFMNYSSYLDGALANFAVDDVTNEQEFLESFAYYFKNGAASERFTSDKAMFRRLIAAATSNDKNKEIRWSLGGNAPVMAIRFFKEGATVLLASKMSSKLRESIPDEIQIAGDLIEDDDVHLILEYKAGETWGSFTAPRANRYILHNDQNNPTLSSLEHLGRKLPEFNSRLLVISGLQMMDSFPFKDGVREARLNKLQQQIREQPRSTLVHFEMASYVEIKLLNLLLTHVIPFSDSLGMNEQELDNLLQVIMHNRVTFASDSNPRVVTALNQMRSVFKLVNAEYFNHRRNDSSRRMLTRIHVHTLAYQAIMVVNQSEWRNSKNAAAKAALTAHRHVCGTDIVNPESSHLILDDSFSTTLNDKDETNAPKRIKIDPVDPVSCWVENLAVGEHFVDVTICVAPVLVCRVARQTAGAGDNISASGLILQI